MEDILISVLKDDGIETYFDLQLQVIKKLNDWGDVSLALRTLAVTIDKEMEYKVYCEGTEQTGNTPLSRNQFKDFNESAKED